MYITNMEDTCEYRRKLEENLTLFYFSKEFSCDSTFNIINTTKISKNLCYNREASSYRLLEKLRMFSDRFILQVKQRTAEAISKQLLIISEPAEDAHENKNKLKKIP